MKRFFKLNSTSFGSTKSKKKSTPPTDDNDDRQRDENRRRSDISTISAASGFSGPVGTPSGSVNSTNLNSLLGVSSTSAVESAKGAHDDMYVVDSSTYRNKLFTKLHKACWTGDLDKVRKAVGKTGVNDVDSELRTPLHLAAARSHKDIIWFLLGSKANPNLPDNHGNTPLLKAVQTRRLDTVQFLLDRGADPNASNFFGFTAIHLASYSGQLDVGFTLICKGVNLNAVDKFGQTPLFLATKSGHIDVARMLLRHGASVNITDKNLRTCLMVAAEQGSKDLLQLMLEHGANVAAFCSQGSTAVECARIAGHNDCLQLLLENVQITNDEPCISSELKRTSIIDDTTNFENVDLDSWNDDDDEEEKSIVSHLKKKIARTSLNLSKFLDDSDRSLGEQSVGSKVSFGLSSTHSPIKPDPSPIIHVVALPPAPAKPKRAASMESCEVTIGDVDTPAVAIVDESINVIALPMKSPRDDDSLDKNKRVRDLMAELGLSDISQLSSLATRSAENDENTDHSIELDDDFETKAPQTEMDSLIGPMSFKLDQTEDIRNVTPVKSKSVDVLDEIIQETDWEVSDDSFHLDADEPKMNVALNVPNETTGKSSINDVEIDVELSVVETPANLFELSINVNGESCDDVCENSVLEVVFGPVNETVDYHDESKVTAALTDGTLGRIDTMQGVDEVWLRNPCRAIAIDLGSGTNSQASSNTKDDQGDIEDDTSCGGIFRAELAKVNSKEDLLEVVTDSGVPKSDSVAAWEKLWMRVCGRLPNDGSQSTYDDESHVDEEIGKSANVVKKDVSLNCQSLQELSSADDQSSFSLNEDQTYRLLLSVALEDPTPATAVHRLATMVQHLRRDLLCEQAQSRNLKQRVSELKIARNATDSKAHQSIVACVGHTNRVIDLEHQLEKTKFAIENQLELTRDVSLELEKQREQLSIAESRYIEEASGRQKAELRARAAELEAENAQLALIEARSWIPTDVPVPAVMSDAITQASVSTLDEGVSVQALIELEAVSYKEELEELKKCLCNAQNTAAQLQAERSGLLERNDEEIGLLRLQLKHSTSELQTILLQKDEAASIINVLNTDLSTIRDQLEDERRKSETLRQEMDEARQMMTTELLRKEAENVKLEAEIEADKNEMKVVLAKCSNLKAELELGESWIEMARNEMESGLSERWEKVIQGIRIDYEAAERVLMDRNDNLAATVESLREEIIAFADREAGYRIELETTNRRLSELHDSSKDLGERNSHLDIQLRERLTEIRNLRTELESCQEELRAVEKRVISADRDVADCEAMKTAECIRLTNELKMTEEKCQSVIGQLADAEMLIKQLNGALGEERVELMNVRERIRKLDEDTIKKVIRLQESSNDSGNNNQDDRSVPDCRRGCLPRLNAMMHDYDTKPSSFHRCHVQPQSQSSVNIKLCDDVCDLDEGDNDERVDCVSTIRSNSRRDSHRKMSSVDHTNCIDRAEVDLMIQRVELRARDEMNSKLGQINDILEERSNSNNRLRDRGQSLECSTAIRELHAEVSRLQKSIESRDMRHTSLVRHCANLCDLIEAKRRVKSKLRFRDELDDVIHDETDKLHRNHHHHACPIYDFGKFPMDLLHSTSLQMPSPAFPYFNNDLRAGIDPCRYFGSSEHHLLDERKRDANCDLRKRSSVNFDLQDTGNYPATSLKRNSLY